MLIKEKFFRWLYLGYDEQTLQTHMDALDDSNLKLLEKICFGGFITFLLCAFIFVFFQKSPARIISFSLTALCSLTIYTLAKAMVNHQLPHSSQAINGLISILIICCCSQATYIGTFKADNDLAVTVICTFALVQVIFDRLPLQNLMLVVPCGITFIICSFLTKNSAITSTYDTIHAFISIVVGFLISWNKSRLKIDNIIINLKLREANYALYHSSTTDALTGLINRRATFEQVAALQNRCKECNAFEMCLIVIDIDNFKAYNDFYGHPKGDKLLEKIGAALKQYASENQLEAGRIGGEEFMVFWQHTPEKSDETIAEELRSVISSLNIPHQNSVTAPWVTISVGIFSTDKKDTFDVETVYTLADQALYKAKEHDKNCCWKYCIDTKTFSPVNKLPSNPKLNKQSK